MPQIVDYASLGQSLADFAHRSDILNYVDYFIAGAQEAIESDIPDLNFGEYIRAQEASYGPFAINNGVVPVPTDWLGPKLLTLTDPSGRTYGLVFKNPEWIYERYPLRSPQGEPCYVARDKWQDTYAQPQSFLCSPGQTAFTLASAPTNSSVMLVSLDGAMLFPTLDYTVAGTTLTLTNPAQGTQTLAVSYLSTSSGSQSIAVTQPQSSFALSNPNASVLVAILDGSVLNSGTDYIVGGGFITLTALAQAGQTLTVYYGAGSVLIFGPYPDGNYTVQGTYYAKAALLSATNTINWMVLYCPTLLQAACMIEVAKFLTNDQLLTRWTGLYQQRLKAFVDRDKAERWNSTLQVERA